MRSISLFSVAALLTCGLCACSDKGASDASSAAAARTTAAVVTGITDCDDFLYAYEQCLTDKVPAASRSAMEAGMVQWRNAWRDVANNPAAKSMLPEMCKQTRDSAREAMKAYDCAF